MLHWGNGIRSLYRICYSRKCVANKSPYKGFSQTLFKSASVIPISIGFSVNKGSTYDLLCLRTADTKSVQFSKRCWTVMENGATTVRYRFPTATQTVWKGFLVHDKSHNFSNHLSTSVCHRRANAPTLFVPVKNWGVSLVIWKVFWNSKFKWRLFRCWYKEEDY